MLSLVLTLITAGEERAWEKVWCVHVGHKHAWDTFARAHTLSLSVFSLFMYNNLLGWLQNFYKICPWDLAGLGKYAILL